MKGREFIATVREGALPSITRKQIGTLLRGLDGKVVKVTIAPYSRKRSSGQNRYYWGVVIPYWKELMKDSGLIALDAEVHEYLCRRVGKLEKEIEIVVGGDESATHLELAAKSLIRALLALWPIRQKRALRKRAKELFHDIDDPTRPMMIARSISELSTREMTAFIELCRAKAAQFGMDIPDPDPEYRSK